MIGRAEGDRCDEQRGRYRRRALPEHPAVGRHRVPRRHMCAEIMATLGDAPALRRSSRRPALSLVELSAVRIAVDIAWPRQRILRLILRLLTLVLRLRVLLLRIIRIAVGRLVRPVARAELWLLRLNVILFQLIR